jgi:hypothetical protein
MSRCIPWEELAEGYYQGLTVKQGRPAKDARLVIGAVIIEHKLCLSDQERLPRSRRIPTCNTSWGCRIINKALQGFVWVGC